MKERAGAWKVTSHASFWDEHSREQPGAPLPFSGEFCWAGSHWVVPGVYSTGKALVVDFCRQVDPEAMKRFLRQWGWTEEAGVDQSRDFTPEEAARIEAESPMSFEFRAEALVNGKAFPLRRSSAVGYLPFPYGGDDMGRRVAEHYGLDLSQGWHIFRCAFPWPRRRQVGSLSLTLKGRKKHLPGQPFSVKAGEQVELPDPATGDRIRLTALALEQLGLDTPALEGWELPPYVWRLTYALEPERPGLTLRDMAPGDPPRPRPPAGGSWGYFGGEDGPTATFAAAGPEAASIGIIGGADGPTAILVREDPRPQGHSALSAPRFAPVEAVTWLPVFSQPGAADLTVELRRTE